MINSLKKFAHITQDNMYHLNYLNLTTRAYHNHKGMESESFGLGRKSNNTNNTEKDLTNSSKKHPEETKIHGNMKGMQQVEGTGPLNLNDEMKKGSPKTNGQAKETLEQNFVFKGDLNTEKKEKLKKILRTNQKK